MEEIKRTACYIRVSTEEQAKHGLSISAQKQTLHTYCQKNNLKIVDFYIDEGTTARKKLNNRLEFQRMLKDIQNNKIDLVIFIKLDRFFRNVADYYKTMEIFENHNVNWKATEEEYDTTTSAGRLNLNIRLSIAQNEADQTSDRINFVFKNKREKGEVTSGSKKFGYNIENKKFVVNIKEANILNDLYNKFIYYNGSCQDTYTYFINTYYKISYDSFIKYLTDTSYIGKYKLYRKDVYIENYIPAIIDEKLFYNVQNFFIKRKHNTKHSYEDTLFDSLLFCNICKKKYTKAIRKRQNNTYISYHCWNSSKLSNNISQKYNCLNRTHISERKIEEYLIDNIKKISNNYILNYTLTTQKTKKVPKTKSKKELIQKKLIKLKDLYLEDLIDKKTYINDYKNLTDELNNIAKDEPISENISFSNINKVKKIIDSDFINIYNSLDKKEKRKVWLELIDKIYIENGVIKEVKLL